jgi:hypothetical protein
VILAWISKPPALGVAAEAIEAAGVPWPDDVPLPPFRAYSSPEAFAALLAGAGFTGAAARLLSWEHRVDPEQWWEQVYLSHVGSNGMVIGRQDTATVARIKNEFDRLIARYAVDAGQVALPGLAEIEQALAPLMFTSSDRVTNAQRMVRSVEKNFN